jgi:cytoskeletal protein CcmA (bactofilin family)
LFFGADDDVSLTHVADTALRLNDAIALQFRDSALSVSSSTDGQLDIAADTELEIVAPTVDIDASTTVTIDTATLAITGATDITGDLDVDNININGNTIISTDTDGNIALTPNGTGEVDISKVDIDSGAIDGTVIGGSSAEAGTFTSLTSNTDLTLASGATVTAILDEDTLTSDSDTALATQQSIKAYVDATVGNADLDFEADTGGALAIDLDSETLTFTGGTGIDTSGADNAVTFAIDSTVTTLTGSQTLTNKTLTTPVISSITNTGTLTLPTTTTTLAGLAIAQEYTATQNFNETTLTDAATIAWDVSANQVTSVTLTANRTFGAPTNQVAGAVYVLTVKQDGTGSHTITWNAVFKWSSSVPTLTTTGSARDIFVFLSDGTNLYEIGRSLNPSVTS